MQQKDFFLLVIYGESNYFDFDDYLSNFNVTDKKTVLEENLKKKPCHKYLSTGSCPFANNCKYRHLNEKELAILKTEVGKNVII